MVDASSHVVVDGIAVTEVGEEAVHLRRGSSDNVVRGSVIRATGLRTKKFGEGIYVGSAKSNWCTYSDCLPDRSDRNVLEGNDIAETTAESVDIKEGTTGGTVRGNTFSGVGMSAADAWVNVKGNEWQIVGNVGADAPEDGFQTHRILDGWGARNTLRRQPGHRERPRLRHQHHQGRGRQPRRLLEHRRGRGQGPQHHHLFLTIRSVRTP